MGQQSITSLSGKLCHYSYKSSYYSNYFQRKSKLRKKDPVSLDPRYRGVRTSRAELDMSSEGDSDEEEEEEYEDDSENGSESEEFDDPETADPERDHIDEDEEIDSDNAFCDSDEEKFQNFSFAGSSSKGVRKNGPTSGKPVKRAVAADFMSSDNDAVSEDEESGGEQGVEDLRDDDSDEMDGVMLNGESMSEDSDEDSEDGGDDDEDDDVGESSRANGAYDAVQEELRNILDQDRKQVMAPISQSAKAEVEKGLAVRVQRRSFDSLLNIRIRLQKALVAVNSLNMVPEETDVGKEAYRAAEEAALKLWNTIDSVRDSLSVGPVASAGQKRKRDAVDTDTSSQAIWDSMTQAEDGAMASRRKVLDKWAAKVQRPTAAPQRKLIAAPSRSLVSVLDDQMLSADRLVKRTRMPRSCAPAQAAKKVSEDADIYDDADFYQLLLKELVDQRTADSSAPGSSAPTVRWAAIKEAKTRKHVDRKASKGRKLRFNVHEKLQNFMAPEDRTTWEQDAINRFCGTLFGQKMELREDEPDAEMDGLSAEEEEGLRLFRG